MLLLSEVLQFVVPCWLVNMSLNLIYIAKLYFPRLITFDKPFDGGRVVWDGQRFFGNSTTWLGIIVALAAGLIIQITLLPNLEQGVIWGLVSGLVVYFGHAFGSFIKRRFGYIDGQYLPFVDHGDYIVIAGIIFGFAHQFSWPVIGIAVLATYILHPLITYLAYLIGWHKHPL